MDNASPTNINALKGVAEQYLQRRGRGQLEQLAARL
jgi:ribose 1,5-bisphosphokinase PhnN